MKIDNLVTVFARAYWRCPMQDCEEAYEVGVRAVVEALRDEMSNNWIDCSHCDQNAKLFSEILGAAGDEVAGVAALEAAGAGLSPASGQAPATDPAPAVCVWVPQDEGPAHEIWKTGCGTMYERAKSTGWCGKCKAPIKFTEAK